LFKHHQDVSTELDKSYHDAVVCIDGYRGIEGKVQGDHHQDIWSNRIFDILLTKGVLKIMMMPIAFGA